MMRVKLSSKGQMVIPKAVREALGLWPGSRLQVQVADGKIILEPIVASAIDMLYGRYTDADLLTDLEKEHRQELQNEQALRP